MLWIEALSTRRRSSGRTRSDAGFRRRDLLLPLPRLGWLENHGSRMGMSPIGDGAVWSICDQID